MEDVAIWELGEILESNISMKYELDKVLRRIAFDKHVDLHFYKNKSSKIQNQLSQHSSLCCMLIILCYPVSTSFALLFEGELTLLQVTLDYSISLMSCFWIHFPTRLSM